MAMHLRKYRPKPLAPAALGAERRTLPGVKESHVRQIFQIIESESPRTIQDLARRLNLSHSHLEHVFKQQTGLTLGHSLLERKMRAAADLLMHSQLCIKEIAYA